MNEPEFREGIAHVVLVVRDLEKAIGQYEKILGMPVSTRRTTRPDYDLGVFRFPGTRLELLCPKTDEGPVARRLKTAGEGMMALAIRFNDREAAIQRHRALGMRLIADPGEGKPLTGEVFVHPSEAGGILVSVIEGE